MAFLRQVKDKAMIFQSISLGNKLINHQRKDFVIILTGRKKAQ